MKTSRFLLITLILGVMLATTSLKADDQPEEKNIEIKVAFIPIGVDNNDHVQVTQLTTTILVRKIWVLNYW